MLEQILRSIGEYKEEDEIIGSCIPGHKFKENREVEILVTRQLLTKYTDSVDREYKTSFQNTINTLLVGTTRKSNWIP